MNYVEKYMLPAILVFGAVMFFSVEGDIFFRTFIAGVFMYMLWGATAGEKPRTKDTNIV